MIPIAKPVIGRDEIDSVVAVLKSGMITQGHKVKEFEEKFAKLCEVRHAVAVNSGTAALHCALYAAGVKTGDEVITSPFTFVATANAIMMQGAKPVFVDIEELTFNIDSDKIESKITTKTKAILPVDLYGHPYEYEQVKMLAERYNLMVIEDACQAVGAEYDGKKCGSLGKIGAFSFYATKNMTTSEGGMLTTNDDKFAELAKRLRHHGQSENARYEYFDMGYNYRMTDITAAIGLCQLKKIKMLNEKRIENAMYLSRGLAKVKGIKIPSVKNKCKHVFHQYTIKINENFKLNRDELVLHLKNKGVGCAVYYPKSLHLVSHIKKFGYKKGDFPVSERLCERVLSLPVHPLLTKTDLDKIIKSIQEVA